MRISALIAPDDLLARVASVASPPEARAGWRSGAIRAIDVAVILNALRALRG